MGRHKSFTSVNSKNAFRRPTNRTHRSGRGLGAWGVDRGLISNLGEAPPTTLGLIGTTPHAEPVNEDPMEQFPYSRYVSEFDVAAEPQNLMAYNGSGSLGAMSSKEAFERVVTSPAFLMWEYELKHGKEAGK
jgi:hypothetical protein